MRAFPGLVLGAGPSLAGAAGWSSLTGVTGLPGDGPQQPVGNNPLVPGKPFFDHPAVAHLDAEFDRTALHHVLVVHHQDIGAQLVIADGHFRHQQGGLLRTHYGRPHPGEQSRQDLAIRIGEDAPELQGAGGGGEADGREIQVALDGDSPFHWPDREIAGLLIFWASAGDIPVLPMTRSRSRSLMVK